MYGATPPVGESTTLPLFAPLQLISVATILDTRASGSVIVTFAVAVRLAASVTVTVYVPAAKPVAVAAVPPDGDQE